MSVQATCKTVINDEASLIDTLAEMYGRENVKTVEAGVNVSGYASSRKPTVLLNVPGLHGTAGFVKAKDGSFELVYDSWDAKKLAKCLPQKKAGKIIHNVLAQTYAKQKIKKALKDLHAKVIRDETDETGTIKMRLRVTQY
jgi:hypothetical protein